jgi:hypothetical protein
MKTTPILVTFLLTLLLPLPSAHSAITGGSVTGGISKKRGGVFKKLEPPIGKVGDDNHQSPNLFGFDEAQGITLEKNLAVDLVVKAGKILAKGPKQITSGTTVSSHYVFYDPINGDIKGTVRFESDIIAIVTTTNKLKASDFLMSKDATYLNPSPRGLERNDHIRVTDPREITIDFTAVRPGDYIRVLTAAAGQAEDSGSQ